jgi:hypothetical protein
VKQKAMPATKAGKSDALDPAALSRNELVQLLNSTQLGAVMTRRVLDRQMNAAGRRWHNGKTINLAGYARWLAAEYAKPDATKQTYAEAKARQASRNREATKAAQDIAPIPQIANIKRREAAAASLRVFCETYFSQTFCLPWSDDHIEVMEIIENVVNGGGMFAYGMPRGHGKTSIARAAALWVVLTGRRPYVVPIAGTQAKAVSLIMRPLKKAILTNKLLAADWPEAVYPLRCLENTAKRQAQQHCGGELTFVHWGESKIVFPSLAAEALPDGLDASPSAGSIIEATSLDSDFRGLQHDGADGRTLRPSLVLLDDPQTRQTAKSDTQTRYRMELLNGDVLGMVGPGETMSAVAMVTRIYREDLSDQLLDRDNNPEWRGKSVPMVRKWPGEKAETLWEKYEELRADGLRRDKGTAAADKFYKKNRKAMDAGCVVSWPDRYDHERELSAVQHAYNLRIKHGPDAFASEYQNEPVLEQGDEDILTAAQVAAKTNGRPAGQAPIRCTHVTGFIDVQDELLYWCVCAWEPNFTGYVIAYGTHPKQNTKWFRYRKARHKLTSEYPGAGPDGAIQAGLEDLTKHLMGREWPRAGGEGVMRISRLFVDMAHKGHLVAAVKHKIGSETMTLARGVGIGAGNIPMTQYRRKPGERYGHHWYMPTTKGTREFQHIAVDVNYWKSFVHRCLATAAGEPGCMSLYGGRTTRHELFSEHIADSEYWTETYGRGRAVREWKLKTSKPDNHWLDCLVGCTAAASMEGIKAPGHDEGGGGRRRKFSAGDFSRAKKTAKGDAAESHVESAGDLEHAGGRRVFTADDFNKRR